MKKLIITIATVILIIIIGMQITIKVFNHFEPIISIVPMGLTIIGVYYLLKQLKTNKNEKV